MVPVYQAYILASWVYVEAKPCKVRIQQASDRSGLAPSDLWQCPSVGGSDHLVGRDEVPVIRFGHYRSAAAMEDAVSNPVGVIFSVLGRITKVPALCVPAEEAFEICLGGSANGTVTEAFPVRVGEVVNSFTTPRKPPDALKLSDLDERL